MNGDRRRRLPWALLASVVLHALVVLFVVTRPKEDRSVPSQAIEVDFVVQAPPPPPPPAPVPPALLPEPVQPPQIAKKKAVTAPVPAPVAAVAAGPEQGKQQVSAPVAVNPADSPRANGAFLVPRVGTMLPEMGTDSAQAEAPGRTIVNGPGEEPDEQAVREYTAERAKDRLDDDLGQMAAQAQRDRGLVNPYFTRLQEDLITGFRGADVKTSPRNTMQAIREEVIETYTQPAERFAKTGSPLANDEQARQFTDSSLGRAVERGGVGAGSDVNSQRMLQAGLQSMAFTAVLTDSVSRPRLKTVLMLRQDGDGALAEAKVIQKSGDSEFDEFVLHLSRKVVRDQGDTSEKGGAPSALGWSSVWQFTWEPPEVKVKLLRVLKGSSGQLPLQ